MPHPQGFVFAEYFAGCSEDICLCFDKRQRARAHQIGKKILSNQQQFEKDLVITFVLVNLELAG